MTGPVTIDFLETDLDEIARAEGRVAVFVSPDGKLDKSARRVNRLTRGVLDRMVQSSDFGKMKPAQVTSLAYPSGMAAEALDVVCLARNPDLAEARKAGVALGKAKGTKPLLVLAGQLRRAEEIAKGIALRAYEFTAHKTAERETAAGVRVMVSKPDETAAAAKQLLAAVEGVHLTRDLVSEPANHLTTTEFAQRIERMKDLGLTIRIFDEAALEKIGMHSLLSVGHGSASPSKVAVMEWMGGRKGDAPLALLGKGVIFDTGGISLKPAAGMEDMTMDMGGAGVVVGTMHALARRGARANVVGIVGLVENMPSDRATRPGDVIPSLKGDTIEVINTDAEGRLVLCDLLWYMQQEYQPAAMVDLATLTGAIIIGLGHEKAGVFSNDETFCKAFLKAAEAEGEGAWHMPLDPAYDEKLKSEIADMKNVGGREAGSITAAQFLKRFVKDEVPWIHLDIAGVALVKAETAHAPKGATGWGVMALDRLVAENYET